MISVSHWYNPARSLWSFKRLYMVGNYKGIADSCFAYLKLVQLLAGARMPYMRLVGGRQFLVRVGYRRLNAGLNRARSSDLSGLWWWITW